MFDAMRQVLNDSPGPIRHKVLWIYVLLSAANVAAWILAVLVFRQHPLLLGTAFLAYSFGLRHAVDADHIAAIDNVTRKLMQEHRKPLLVGFWFSLGHSTIVVALSVMVALTTTAIQERFPAWKEVGGVIGTSVSAAFLLLIAVVNLVILRDVFRAFRAVRRGDEGAMQGLDGSLLQGGLLARLTRPLFRLITRSWHMYPLGVLFGLGFDTATEVGLLGISASQATQGLPIWSIVIFPVLFTVGMSLVDTTDGILMLGAYGWAYLKPIRKLYYNMTITSVSVAVALLVGGIEALGLIADRYGFTGNFWQSIGSLNDHFGLLGYGIIGIFILAWLLSVVVYWWRGCDRIGVEVPPEAGKSLRLE